MWNGHAGCLTEPFPGEEGNSGWLKLKYCQGSPVLTNPPNHLIVISRSLEIIPWNVPPTRASCVTKCFQHLLCKQWTFLSPFQFRPSWITAIWYHGNSEGKARPGIVEEQSFKALIQSTLMDDLRLACMYGLVWLEHLSLFCQQQIRLPGHTSTWLTRLPAIDNASLAVRCRIMTSWSLKKQNECFQNASMYKRLSVWKNKTNLLDHYDIKKQLTARFFMYESPASNPLKG